MRAISSCVRMDIICFAPIYEFGILCIYMREISFTMPELLSDDQDQAQNNDKNRPDSMQNGGDGRDHREVGNSRIGKNPGDHHNCPDDARNTVSGDGVRKQYRYAK